MVKKIPILITMCLLFLSFTYTSHADEFSAYSYIVMDANTNSVLEQKNMHETRSVASISKIMTAIVALEKASLDTQITIGEEIDKAYGSAIYIKHGDVLTLEDLLQGLLLRSGNDAALAIAHYIGGGSVANFVEMMNEKAKELNMLNSIFVNPHGLDEEDGGNISSSYDMALLMSHCINNEDFKRIASTKSYTTADKQYRFLNKNRLLSMYDKTIAGKTGYTTIARRTLINAAKSGEVELVVVTLNSGNDFNMHKTLFEKYFNLYETVTLIKKGNHQMEGYRFYVDQDLTYGMMKESKGNYRLLYDIRVDENMVHIALTNGDSVNYIAKYELVEEPQAEKEKGFFDFIRRLFS